MPTGKVKWFSASKGFGFIMPDDGSADVFLHLSKVEEANLPTLESGTALQYSIGSRSGKVFAEGLSIISRQSLDRTVQVQISRQNSRKNGACEGDSGLRRLMQQASLDRLSNDRQLQYRFASHETLLYQFQLFKPLDDLFR